MRCAVLHCNENNKKAKPSVRFYTFPKDKNLRKQWVDFCRRKDVINTKTARICSSHFKPTDFLRNMQFEMGFCNRNGYRLKPHTVPTVEPTSSSRSKRKQPAIKEEVLTNLQVEILDPEEACSEEEIEIKKTQESDSSEISSIYAEKLENRIAFLNHEIETLRWDNLQLQESEKRSSLKIHSLQRLLRKSELDRINLEDKLRKTTKRGVSS